MSASIMLGTSPCLIAMFARYIASVDLPVSVSPTSITMVFLPIAKPDICRARLSHIEVPACLGSAHHNLAPYPSRACSVHHLLPGSNGSALPALTFTVCPDTSLPRTWHAPFTTTLAGPFIILTLSPSGISLSLLCITARIAQNSFSKAEQLTTQYQDSKRLFLLWIVLPLNLSAPTGPESRRPSGEHHQHHQHQLVRTLSLMDIIMVGIAGMIGGAIFVLTGPAIGLAGSAVILAFIINATITLFTAMGYAELGSALPEAGGGYLWVREGLPRPNAFISGWMAWFAHIVAGSLYAVGYGSFQFSLLQMLGIVGDQPLFGFIPLDKLIAVLSIAAFAYVNVKGASETGKLGIIVTVIQLGTIFALIGAGFLTINNNPDWTSNFMANFVPIGIGGIVAAMGLTFIAFEGYEIIVQTGEEVKNPRKNIPRAIFISLTLVVLLYCLVAFVSISAVSPRDTGGIPAWNFIGQYGDLGISKAAEIFLPYGSFIILAGGIVSSLAALNATTYSSARVAFAMGRHYNLPHQLSNIHHKFKTPYVATIISAIIMATMAYALPLTEIALASGVIFLLLFTQVNISVITIRRMYGDKLHYGFKTPFFPVIPIIGIFLKLGLAIFLLITQPTSWLISVLWIAIGFAIYRIYIFRKEIEHYAPIVTSEGDLARKYFRILIPYTPENPDRLIKYAIRVAKENNGEINILRVITVPHQTPLSAGTAFTERAAKDFEPLEKIIDIENIPNHYFVRISHDANEAILSTIEEQRIGLLITDYETLRRNKVLQTLATCNMLAILTGGISDEELALEDSIADRGRRKKEST